MQFSSRGDLVGGQGASGVWLTVYGTPARLLLAPPCGKPQFYNDDTIVYQSPPRPEDKIKDWHLRLCDLQGRDLGIASGLGANILVGGCWVWAAVLTNGALTMRTSWGLTIDNCCPLSIADGALLVLTNFRTGQGVACYRVGETDPTKPLWRRDDAWTAVLNDQPQACLVTATQAVWRDPRGNLQAYGFDQPQQVTGAFNPSCTLQKGGPVLAYHTAETPPRYLSHYLSDASRGAVVAVGDTFGTTSLAIAVSTFLCAWTPTADETGAPGTRAVTVSEFGPWHVTPVPPVPPDPPVPPIPPIPPIPPHPPVTIPIGVLSMPTDLRLLQHYGENPQPDGKVTYTADPATGDVWSIQPNGNMDKRSKGTATQYEKFLKNADTKTASIRPATDVYSFLPVNVTGV